MASQVFGAMIVCAIGLLVLYYVIYIAVKDGIDKSIVGQYLREKQKRKEDQQLSFDKENSI